MFFSVCSYFVNFVWLSKQEFNFANCIPFCLLFYSFVYFSVFLSTFLLILQNRILFCLLFCFFNFGLLSIWIGINFSPISLNKFLRHVAYYDPLMFLLENFIGTQIVYLISFSWNHLCSVKFWSYYFETILIKIFQKLFSLFRYEMASINKHYTFVYVNYPLLREGTTNVKLLSNKLSPKFF